MNQTAVEYEEVVQKLRDVKNEISRYIVGQEQVIEELLWSIFSGGHAILEGLPGLGKTALIKTVAQVLDLSFSRIQFTPDLMPSDITGTLMLQPDELGKQQFHFFHGPIFSQIVLADEINRATPKTQSALLEAMAEKTVTIMGDTRQVETPFFVLATQNPIDLEGTYPLPEAQMDRFLSKIIVHYPTKAELMEIVKRTEGEEPLLNKIMSSGDVLKAQSMMKDIMIADEVLETAVQLISMTHPENEESPEDVKKYIHYGSGPRGLQALIRLAKTRALMNGRFHVSVGDIKKVAPCVLRHRLFLNFEGEAAGIKSDDLLSVIISEVKHGREVNR
ncbi:AAA family ATPase [Bacillus sp. 2205SS5-2]|uniref:AAA family ATPase n=1 Tax=Bacillus sp. 2205SS5-2 TaxID=3109031 RepID=UPI0030071961